MHAVLKEITGVNAFFQSRGDTKDKAALQKSFTDGFSAAGVTQSTWILTLVLNASKLVTRAIWVMFTFALRDCK